MPRFAFSLLLICLYSLASFGQGLKADQPNSAAVSNLNLQSQDGKATSPAASAPSIITVPAGTKVLLVLQNNVSTRNARNGDGVYLQTSFPVSADGRLAIPPGTYVEGVIDRVQRPGRVKGRGEILMHFTGLTFPNGYKVFLPGSVESTDAEDNAHHVKGSEGTIQASGTKTRDAVAIATATGAGAGIGAAAGEGKGAAIGSGAGALLGIAAVLLTRGNDLRLDSGTTIEMVLERPLQLEYERLGNITAVNAWAVPPAPLPERRLRLDRQGCVGPCSVPVYGPGPVFWPRGW